MNVLLIDDDAYDAFEVTSRIKSLRSDALVVHASSSEDALEEISSHKSSFFDVIFVDQHMPGKLGTDLCLQLKQLYVEGSPPLILLTSDGTDTTRSKALANDCDGFLTKPADNNRLRKLLDGKRCHWNLADLPSDLDLYRSFLQSRDLASA
ncbi:response regulator [uncultured Roseobacter sp.]|uniref:response regulator n=1 Tax=uncultured Roseobacter sp. TaxID=114847 RepID=UPI00262B3115|nr:response regulator [uncultured Roseobacter sp.]